ncbi:MAG: ABC-type transport auxiliary lipoprotein family protein [Kiritimatiellae bacterium]|nr:ABC-type transport auxiliary lipoprotein family protein [Kiritimatiellia bacterium]
MLRNLLAASLLLFLTGCFSSSLPESHAWTVSPRTDLPSVVLPPEGQAAFAVTRLGAVTVSAPYDKPPFVVHRSDGSVAFDAYNVFASTPAALVRSAVKNRFAADGRFGHVVESSSSAAADAQVEVTVTNLSLDCRENNRRMARATVSVDVVKMGRGPRDVALSGSGSGEADASSGDYTAAFSSAFDNALAEALRALK